jgi:hypothetical protein
MDAGLIERIETAAERGASALLAAAVAYAAYWVTTSAGLGQPLRYFAAGTGTLAFLPCLLVLRAAANGSGRFALPEFALRDFEFSEAQQELLPTDPIVATEELLLTEQVVPAELLLSDSDRVDPVEAQEDVEPLVLDDILAEIGSDARVVRLFDRKAMPAPALTPGQLQSRIADHLADGAPLSAPYNVPATNDASQALSAALAELRRSLR